MILSSIHFKSNIKYLIHHVRLSVGHKEYIHLSIPTLDRQTDRHGDFGGATQPSREDRGGTSRAGEILIH